MKLTDNFSKSEFECKDGSEMPQNVLDNIKQLSKELQVLRDFTGKPIKINSGYRSPIYNKSVGGAKYSQHLLGKAADIRIEGLSPREVYGIIGELIKDGRMRQGGLGKYNSFTHYDIRGTKARWNG